MRCDCGLDYVSGHPEDEEEHARIHAEYSFGPEIPAVERVSPCGIYRTFSLYEINQACPIAIRRELAHVAWVACHSMSGYPLGYDGSVTEDDQRLYIAADNAHIVALSQWCSLRGMTGIGA